MKGEPLLLLTISPPPSAIVRYESHHTHRRRSHAHSGSGSGFATYYNRGDSNPHLADGTWYGENGPMFCAAPRSIPLGTVLKIHSLVTGRTIRVVVRDYGPRHIDLSRGAFQRLGGRGGRIPIETQVVQRGHGRPESHHEHRETHRHHRHG
jgi:rare lipoprotein A (peptidoglycan hydrolase)